MLFLDTGWHFTAFKGDFMSRHETVRKEIEKNLYKRQATLVLSALFTVLSAAGIILFGSELYVFLPAAIVFIASMFFFSKALLDKRTSFFQKEKRGVITDKKIKQIMIDKLSIGGYGQANARYTDYRTPAITSTLFIKDTHGKIFTVGGLNSDQTEFYEIGDEVIIFKGARFPIVTNEPASRQKWICPVCGTVSPDGVDCGRCGMPFSYE